jgi:menaquinone-dependent protoporphyrinogen oxidase
MTKQKLSRRRFLQAAGLTLAAGAFTCAGTGYLATRTPGVETPALTFGEGNERIDQRILVTYATRAGSTAAIAAAIGETLSQRGLAVDVQPVKDAPDLQGYRAVLIGSAVRMGRWLPEAVRFVEAHQPTLSGLDVALFTVHMNNTGTDEADRAARRAYLDAVRPLLDGAEEAYFAGQIDLSHLSFLDRLIVAMMGGGETDERDWDAIRAWMPNALA